MVFPTPGKYGNFKYITLTSCIKRVFYKLCYLLNLVDLDNDRTELGSFKKRQEVVETSYITGVLSTEVFKMS